MADHLAAWTDGPTLTAIRDFVDRVTTEGGPDFVPPPERIAVFDNDGTLWCEKPGYVQAYFLVERLAQQAAEDDAVAADPVVHALLAGDLHAAAAHGIEALGDVLLRTHAGWTADEFAAAAREWFARARDPATGRPFA